MKYPRRVVIGFDAPGGGSVRSRGGWAVVCADTGEYIDSGRFEFEASVSEADQIRAVWDAFDSVSRHQPGVAGHRSAKVISIAIEHAFIFKIAGWVGVAKAWAAAHTVPWYQITASSAGKEVLGDGRVGKAAKKVGLNSKKSAHDYAVGLITRWERGAYADGVAAGLTQHEADAILYAVAVAQKLRKAGGAS